MVAGKNARQKNPDIPRVNRGGGKSQLDGFFHTNIWLKTKGPKSVALIWMGVSRVGRQGRDANVAISAKPNAS